MANSKICMQSKSEDFGNPEELRGILQEIKSGTITLLNDPNNPHIYQLEFTDDCLQIEEDDFFKFVEQATELSTESTKIQYVFLTKYHLNFLALDILILIPIQLIFQERFH